MGLFSTYTYKEKVIPYTQEVKFIGLSPDEASKLLREYEKQAKENIIEQIDVSNNIINGKIIIFQDHLSASKKAILKIKLNGKDYQTDFNIDRILDRDERYQEFREKVSRFIIQEMLVVDRADRSI